MELSKSELCLLNQALGYAVMYAKTESETAEFALLKIKVEEQVIRMEELKKRVHKQKEIGCPFNYCDSNPPCNGVCRYNIPSNL